MVIKNLRTNIMYLGPFLKLENKLNKFRCSNADCNFLQFHLDTVAGLVVSPNYSKDFSVL